MDVPTTLAPLRTGDATASAAPTTGVGLSGATPGLTTGTVAESGADANSGGGWGGGTAPTVTRDPSGETATDTTDGAGERDGLVRAPVVEPTRELPLEAGLPLRDMPARRSSTASAGRCILVEGPCPLPGSTIIV